MIQLLNQIAIPRAVGTEGNKTIIELQKRILEKNGYTITSMPFSCKVWNNGDSRMEWNEKRHRIMASPYSKGFCGEGNVIIVKELEELQETDCEDAILFLTEELAKEPLQPKDYPFYYPDEHKNIIDLLERKKPLAIIAVTGKHPMCGLNPYPLFEDGNFRIPSAYMSITDFQKIKEDITNKRIRVEIVSECVESTSEQIYATKQVENSLGKIVIGAHMDTKNDTQGALDNASGIVVLLKTAEKLCLENYDVDIVPFNSEEYYGGNGELLYLSELQKKDENIILFINIDSVGHVGSKVDVSLYNIPDTLKTHIDETIEESKNVQLGEAWYAGDHAAFAFQGVPCLAIASSDMWEGGLDHTHTMEDTIQTVDAGILDDAVSFIDELLRKF